MTMPETKKRIAWKEMLGLVLILAVAAVLRLQHIKADPPALISSVSGSAGIYFDEGIYCHNARNKILFGQWITDEWNPIVYNAPLTLLYYVAFKAFGISIVTVKALSILFGLCGILLFFIGVRAYLGPAGALGLTALFSLDFYGLMYNRIGLLENFSSLFFLASFALFAVSRGRPRMSFFLGMTSAVAALSKYLFVFFPIAAALAVAYQARKRSDAEVVPGLPGRRAGGRTGLARRDLSAVPADVRQDRGGLGNALPAPFGRPGLVQSRP